MPAGDVASRVSRIEALVPRPPSDVVPLRAAFAHMVSKQWLACVPAALQGCESGLAQTHFAKGRFIAEMYARACYSMFLVSRRGPKSLRIPLRAVNLLPPSRKTAIRLGRALLAQIDRLLPQPVHHRLLLTSALMGMLDVVLDDAAWSGEAAALRIASLVTRSHPASLSPPEQVIVTLARAARLHASPWQADYWERVLEPAVRRYCVAEVRGVERAPDLTGMGHRWSGIEAAIKGMWYVTAPLMGLDGDLSLFEDGRWNPEQQWMADTTLLLQMIDDWVDQDEDRNLRLTPVITGDWTLDSAQQLFQKTIRDLDALLHASRITSPVLKTIFADLYIDYLHTALEAMRTGLAA